MDVSVSALNSLYDAHDAELRVLGGRLGAMGAALHIGAIRLRSIAAAYDLPAYAVEALLEIAADLDAADSGR